jgi:uncharacterized protein YecA (UPF0149 family)
MPYLPAFCDECGLIFPGMYMPQGTGMRSTGNISGCPRCGAMAHVLEGFMNIAGNTIQILQGTNKTATQLARLQEVLRTALQTRQAPEEVAAAVKEAGFGALAEQLLVPKTAGDFYALIAVILAGAALCREHPTPPTQVDHDKVVNQVIQQIYNYNTPSPSRPEQSAPAQGATPAPAQSPKPGGDEPCTCGSGKKYKHCCGKLVP